ncbi:GntR family transcriptional regulator [Mollicutes bacterium LVI A0078]|nr:GntR family transcriptional regulator [Mollicutes bacterium LVI A0075]WOO90726.1 GntR family transcriptional regulator [Mollicutes bacterium LVI A0078]
MKKYEIVYTDLKSKISNNFYSDGKLPTEKELELEYKCSRQTVKTAMELLLQEGLIYRRKGKGTFVRKNLFADNVSASNKYLLRNDNDLKSRKTILSFVIRMSTEEDMTKLNLPDAEYVYAFSRLRFIEDSPEVIENTIIPLRLIPNLTEDVLEGSLLAFLHANLPISIDSIQKRFTIKSADENDIVLLKLSKTDCVVRSEEIIILDNNQIVAYGELSYSPRKFEYFSVINNVVKQES